MKARRPYSRPVDRSTGLIRDQTIVPTGFYTRQKFDSPLRRVKFKDPETKKTLVFLNNFALPAMTIAKLSKNRWQVELFFKWIKQPSTYQSLFRRLGEHRQSPNLVGDLRLRTHRHRQKTDGDNRHPSRNPTDFAPHTFRENSAFEPVSTDVPPFQISFFGVSDYGSIGCWVFAWKNVATNNY
jgi:hypothetical protein